MARRDPYADPYDRRPRRRFADGGSVDDDGTQVSVNVPGAGTPLPGAVEAATAFSQKHQSRIDAREKEIRDTMEKQQLNVDQMTKILDEASSSIKRNREGRTSLPLLKMGAAMMTTPGNFGTSLGAGFGAMAEGISATRKEETDEDMKMLDLQMKKATLANAPLEQRLSYIKALQTGDIAAQRSIETAILKAQLTGNKPPTGRMALVEKLKEENPGMTTEQALAKLQELSERNAVDMQKVDRLNRERAAAGQQPLSYLDAMAEIKRNEAQAGAAGRESGTETAKAKMAYPTIEANMKETNDLIERMINHAGIDNAVGRSWANVPGLPGSPKADWEALEANLKGKIFMTAYNGLRGAGAITEAEGLKAEADALANSRKQSKEAYIENLRRYQEKLKIGLEIARIKAGLPPSEKSASATTPTSSTPTPPGQTGQTPSGQFHEGQTATGPNGAKMIFRNGNWVPKE